MAQCAKCGKSVGCSCKLRTATINGTSVLVCPECKSILQSQEVINANINKGQS